MYFKKAIVIALVLSIVTPVSAQKAVSDLVRELTDWDENCYQSEVGASALTPKNKANICACFAGSITAVDSIGRIRIWEPNSTEFTPAGKTWVGIMLEACMAKYKCNVK